MFFVTYVRHELRRRMRQAIVIALGLALGVGLVVTVAAASAAVTKAQFTVLGRLYGVATDVTVTGPFMKPPKKMPKGTVNLGFGPHGPKLCALGGKCTNVAGKTAMSVESLDLGFSASKVAAAARLPGVAAAAGGISLSVTSTRFPKSGPINPAHNTSGYILDGVDTGHPALSPLGSATLASGHSFTAADANADVAVVDAGYAKSHGLKTGAHLAIEGTRFTLIGIARQAGSNPPGVYVPLTAAQDLSLVAAGDPSMKGKVNKIYLTAASAADVPKVTAEITRLLPGTTVDSASNLATAVTGSVTRAAKLAHDLGRWLAVLVLIAAFAVASLLTMAAVARRSAEFGTLKALGWRTRRIIAQVLGESAAVGLAGAAAGIALGYAGAAIIAAVSVSATAGANTLHPPPGQAFFGGSPVQTVAVPLHPSVSAGLIALAVLLAVGGALLAGSFGSWRIARLRPADALSRIA
jgi:putative ABC transport system permease protein